MKRIIASTTLLLVAVTVGAALAKTNSTNRPTVIGVRDAARVRAPLDDNQLFSRAVASTTTLGAWTFDNPSCADQGWTQVDLTQALDGFFHIDDFSGLGNTGQSLCGVVPGPIEGNYSLWGGRRPSTTESPFCNYTFLPGYGHNEDIAYCTDACLNVTGDVHIDYKVQWEAEPYYDGTSIEFDDGCGGTWTPLTTPLTTLIYDPSVQAYTHCSTPQVDQAVIPAASHGGTVRVRFHFRSDGASDDDDAQFPGYTEVGAILLDSLSIRDDNGIVLAVEDFEDMDDQDWSECITRPGYGTFSGVQNAAVILQQDPCADNLTCVWEFFEGSGFIYDCGSFPGQATVPYEIPGVAGFEHIRSEIWSPPINDIGTGSEYRLSFRVYLDNPLDNLVFYTWAVRSLAGTCWGEWQNRGEFYFDDTKFDGLKQWRTVEYSFGEMVEPGATQIQIALGVADLCDLYCGTLGSGSCHSHAPLFDDVVVTRVSTDGPQFNVADGNQFQDTFASTMTGKARIDQATDRVHPVFASIVPGDSATITVADPNLGLATDPHTGSGPAVYMYVSVWPQNQPGKQGTAITDDAARWPVVDSLVHAGSTWYCVRADSVFPYNVVSGPGDPLPDRWCVDVNDNLFEPGDTLCFIWAATSAGGAYTNYYTPYTGPTDDMALALDNPDEVTVLPAGGVNRGGSILFIDGAGDIDEQSLWTWALGSMGLEQDVDRYDIRQPSSGLGNRPGARVKNVLTQLIPNYTVLIWSSGRQAVVLGEGTTGGPDKSPDVQMLTEFLDFHNGSHPLAYLVGDDFAEALDGLSTGPALASQFFAYSLTSPNAYADNFGASPLCIGAQATFEHVAVPDSFIAYGGCPELRRFDVLEPTGAAGTAVTYGLPDNLAANGESTNSAVITQFTNNAQGNDVRVFLSGFGFGTIADTRPNLAHVYERAHHLFDILLHNGSVPEPSAAGGVPLRYELAQNYPNPFNPTTTIAFTLAERTRVTLKIYNVAGQLVRTLVDEERAPGVSHTATWDGRDDGGQSVSSGVYFYRLRAGDFEQTRKMVLLK